MRRADIKSLLILGLCIFAFIAAFIITAGLNIVFVVIAVSFLAAGAASMLIAYCVFRNKLL